MQKIIIRDFQLKQSSKMGKLTAVIASILVICVVAAQAGRGWGGYGKHYGMGMMGGWDKSSMRRKMWKKFMHMMPEKRHYYVVDGMSDNCDNPPAEADLEFGHPMKGICDDVRKQQNFTLAHFLSNVLYLLMLLSGHSWGHGLRLCQTAGAGPPCL